MYYTSTKLYYDIILGRSEEIPFDNDVTIGLIAFLPLKAFHAFEMLFATYTLGACLLL